MNLNQLRFARAAAATASFSRAAEMCHVTQPTLSNGISQLEEELQGKLFARTTRQVSLTSFGEHVLPLIDAVLTAQGELEVGAKAFFNPDHHLLRIGLSPVIDARLLNQVLEPYRSEHPNTDVFFKECFLEDLDHRLRSGQVDVVLRPYLEGDALGRGIARAKLYEEDFYYMPRQGARTAKKVGAEVCVKDIAGETFILSNDGCGLATATRNLFSEAGLSLIEYGGRTMSYQVMQEWADLGIGATILPKSRFVQEFSGNIARLMVSPGKPARLRVDALWGKASAYPPHISDFHDHIRDRAPSLIKGSALVE